jgi:hypothetical protein
MTACGTSAVPEQSATTAGSEQGPAKTVVNISSTAASNPPVTTTSTVSDDTSTTVTGPQGVYPEPWVQALVDAANSDEFDRLDGFAFVSEAKRDLFRVFVESDLPELEATGSCEVDNGSLEIDGKTRWGCPVGFDRTETYWIVLSSGEDSFADVEVRPDGAFADTTSDGSYGSGCDPGPGPLPDGIWFGFAAARHPDELDFDLACLYPDPVADARIVNESPTLRSLSVDSDVLVRELIPTIPVTGGTTYGNWEAAWCPLAGSCPVWVRILDGRVIYIAEQFFS